MSVSRKIRENRIGAPLLTMQAEAREQGTMGNWRKVEHLQGDIS